MWATLDSKRNHSNLYKSFIRLSGVEGRTHSHDAEVPKAFYMCFHREKVEGAGAN